MKRETAESVAAEALGWIVEDAELLGVFLGSTGIAVADIRERAASPAFLASVLDFVMLDDAWVIGFCDAAGYGYEVPGTARAALPGGERVHWT